MEGSRSLEIQSDREGFDPLVLQEVKEGVGLNKRYRLKYEAKAAKFGQDYRVYVGVWKGRGEEDWVTGEDVEWRQGQEAWQQVSTEFTISSAEATFMQVVFQIRGPGTVWFDNVSLTEISAASTQSSSLPPPIPKYVGSDKFVQITPERGFKINGKPFFPIKIWGWNPKTEADLAQLREFGFNTFGSEHADALGTIGTGVLLDKASKFGLKVMLTTRVEFDDRQVATLLPDKLKRLATVIASAKDHPALFCYNLADEPAWLGYNLTAFSEGANLIRSIDPNHPISVNHAPRNKISELQAYNQYVDIAGSDIYPVWAGGKDIHSDLPNKTISVVGDETIKNLEAVDYKKPVIQTLQAFSWSDGARADRKGDPFPTHDQLRFMAYDAIVAGASGIAYFQDGRYPTLRPELKDVVQEIAALQDVLAGGATLPVTGVIENPGIEVLAKSYKDKIVLIVLNKTESPIDAEFNLAPLNLAGQKSLKMPFSNNEALVSGGVLKSTFAPFTVQIFTNAESPEQVLSVTDPANAIPPVDAPSIDSSFNELVPKGARNLALNSAGTRATASSEIRSMEASRVNDGDRFGAKWNDSTIYEYPDWVELEFPKPSKLNKILVFTEGGKLFGKNFSGFGIRDFDVQVNEGGAWKTVKTFKAFDETVAVANVSPLVTSKIRVLVHSTNGNSDYTRIVEVEAYGP